LRLTYVKSALARDVRCMKHVVVSVLRLVDRFAAQPWLVEMDVFI
jgi:hypothetical protein